MGWNKTYGGEKKKTYSSGVVGNSEVSFLAAGLGGLWLDERGRFAQMVVVQLLSKGLISGFWKHRLFLKDGQDTHGLKDFEENIRISFFL